MSQPYQRMTANLPIALANVRPVSVFLEPKKNAQGARVSTTGQHDFITFLKCGMRHTDIRHVRVLPWATAEISACSLPSPFPTWLLPLLLRSPIGPHPSVALPDRRAAALPVPRPGPAPPAFC